MCNVQVVCFLLAFVKSNETISYILCSATIHLKCFSFVYSPILNMKIIHLVSKFNIRPLDFSLKYFTYFVPIMSAMAEGIMISASLFRGNFFKLCTNLLGLKDEWTRTDNKWLIQTLVSKGQRAKVSLTRFGRYVKYISKPDHREPNNLLMTIYLRRCVWSIVKHFIKT